MLYLIITLNFYRNCCYVKCSKLNLSPIYTSIYTHIPDDTPKTHPSLRASLFELVHRIRISATIFSNPTINSRNKDKDKDKEKEKDEDEDEDGNFIEFFLYAYNGKSHFKKVIYSRLLDILCKMEIITQK